MTEFVFVALPMEASYYHGSGWSKSVLLYMADGHDVRKPVEARNVKELQPLFASWVADMAATGKPWQCTARMRRNRDRKPPGFNKATDPGGSLFADVNWEVAKESFLAKQKGAAA